MSAARRSPKYTTDSAANGSTTRAMGDARIAMDEVARMAASLSSAVGRFRY